MEILLLNTGSEKQVKVTQLTFDGTLWSVTTTDSKAPIYAHTLDVALMLAQDEAVNKKRKPKTGVLAALKKVVGL
jgi:hypothetical protein